jgi:Eukaryotic protein of unknown function (DUF866)
MSTQNLFSGPCSLVSYPNKVNLQNDDEMVVFVLYIKADLEGVASVSYVPGTNLCISVRNPLNDYEIRENVVVETDVLLEVPEPTKNSRNDHVAHREPACNFAFKWEGAAHRSTIQIKSEDNADTPSANNAKKGKAQSNSTAGAVATRDMFAQDSGSFVPILALDCHGVEPYAFHPLGDEFVVTNKDGIKFDSVDLSTGAWSDFDLGTGTTSISNLESKFV